MLREEVQQSEVQLSIRVTTTRRPIGLRLNVPAALTIVSERPGCSFSAVEHGPSGKLRGEIDLSVITPGLIIDRDGVLLEAAARAADAYLAPPRDGYLLHMGEVTLSAGTAFRVDAVLLRGEDGRIPALGYQTVVAMGHPNLSLPVALFLTMRFSAQPWPAGDEILDSIAFTDVAASSAREAIVLPLAV